LTRINYRISASPELLAHSAFVLFLLSKGSCLT